MSDIAIKVEGLGKRYRIGANQEAYRTLREKLNETALAPFRAARHLLTRNGNGQGGPRSSVVRPSRETFWALKDVSFEVKRGEVVGIIGRNGAGKSTLLKILSRITEPTEGYADINGRIASLLEVGTGFHPELTGRENIFLNGSILGMKRAEIKQKFDEIVAFAEIEKFMDTPVKHYSSGMYVRLAFAVAAHLDPEILLVDEVLAVGDVAFQKKCLGKMGEVAREGRTVIFVSHNMQVIRQLCGTTVLLANGQKVAEGESGRVVERYLEEASGGESLEVMARVIRQLPPDPVFRLKSVDVSQDGESSTRVVSGKPLEITIEYEVFEHVAGLHVYISFYDSDGILIFDSLNNGDARDFPVVVPGKYFSRATIPADFLTGRSYGLEVNAGIHNVRNCIPQPSAVSIKLNVTSVGQVNRAYPGYVTQGRIAPLIPWHTEVMSAR